MEPRFLRIPSLAAPRLSPSRRPSYRARCLSAGRDTSRATSPAFPPSSDCYAINDRQLGDEAEAAVKAFQNVCESSATKLAKNEPRLASAYHSAYEAARTAGPFSPR